MTADQNNLDLFDERPKEPVTNRPSPLSGPPPLWADEDGDPVDRSLVTADSGGGGAASDLSGHSAVADPEDPVYQKATSNEPEPVGAPDAEPKIWTPAQVNRGVRTLLESTFPQIWVEGEVGRWTRSGPGHCYFTLKDDRAQLKCVMFQSDAARLPMDPDEGMTVRVFGSLTLYEARGEYQLTARRLETATGEGLWRLAFERLRKQLDAEGLLAPDRKRPLPRFPAALGVVTSLTGAALRDVLTVVRRRAPWTRVVVRGARVQGEGAGAEIAAAVDALGSSGLVDTLIVGRGGGSVEDLWAFNEEVVARALAACPVPVISAVGHEVDTTIADLVADVRAATPSAAAEAAVPDRDTLTEALGVARVRLARGLVGMVDARRRRIRDRVSHLGKAARRIVEPRRQSLSVGMERMKRAMTRKVAPRRHQTRAARDRLTKGIRALIHSLRRSLSAVTGRMDALSPLATLRRGYAVPLDDDGRLLRTTDDFEVGGQFDLRVVDGRIRAQTLETETDEESSGRSTE